MPNLDTDYYLDEIERNQAIRLQKIPYSGEVIYSRVHDEYFSGEQELMNYCEENELHQEEMQIVFCKPNMPRKLNYDFFNDDMDDGQELPEELAKAIDNFNATVEAYGKPLSYSPGRVSVDLGT